MKTIRELAGELGVSKQAVHQKIKRHPLSNDLRQFISTVGGVVYIDEQGEMLIKQAFSQRKLMSDHAVDVNESSTNVNESSIVDSKTFELLQENFKVLQAQLAEKDEQIKNLNAALLYAQQTTEVAQKLHSGSIQKQLFDAAAVVDNSAEKPRKRHGLFGWFKKH